MKKKKHKSIRHVVLPAPDMFWLLTESKRSLGSRCETQILFARLSSLSNQNKQCRKQPLLCPTPCWDALLVPQHHIMGQQQPAKESTWQWCDDIPHLKASSHGTTLHLREKSDPGGHKEPLCAQCLQGVTPRHWDWVPPIRILCEHVELTSSSGSGRQNEGCWELLQRGSTVGFSFFSRAYNCR